MSNKKFTKNDLKAGYVVKDRGGCLYMIMTIDSGCLVAVDSNEKWLSLSGSRCDAFDIHPSSSPSESQYDIMEVYGFCAYSNKACRISTEHRKLLWKREPEKTCDNCIHKPVCNHVGTCEHFMNKV